MNRLQSRLSMSSLLLNVILLISCLYIFAPSFRFISVTAYSAILIVLLILYYLSTSVSLTISKSQIPIILFFFICLFSIPLSSSVTESAKYCVTLCICLLLFACLSKFSEWITSFKIALVVISLISALLTILSSINFSAFEALSRGLISNNTLQYARKVARHGAYSGIIGQTGTNAFSIVPLVVICFCNLINKNKRVLSIVGLLIGVWATFLTMKRGAVLWGACALALVLLIDLRRRRSRYFFRVILIIGFASIAFFVAYNNLNFVRALFDRFDFSNVSDMSLSRVKLSNQALVVIKNHPFGIGINAYAATYGENVHNDFLQITAEIGILGTALLFGLWGAFIWKAVKILFKNKTSNIIEVEIIIVLLLYHLLSSFTSFPIHNYGFCIQVFILFAAVSGVEKSERSRYCENSNSNIQQRTELRSNDPGICTKKNAEQSI